MKNLAFVLIEMLRQLLVEMQTLPQLGSGYFACLPIIQRYNKLLSQARTLFPGGQGPIATFDDAAEVEPKDPSDKMKTILAIRLETGQLISLLQATRDDHP